MFLRIAAIFGFKLLSLEVPQAYLQNSENLCAMSIWTLEVIKFKSEPVVKAT